MRKAAAAVRTSIKNNRQTATAAAGSRPAVSARPSAGAARRAAVPVPVAKPQPALKLVPKPRLGPVAVPAAPPPAPAAGGGAHEDFRRLLVARRQELTGNLEDTKFDTLARMGRVAEDDQAQISHEEFISLQRNSMDYQALRQVNAALERIHAGEFGVCAHCDEPISEKRLKAIPWAKYCVICQDRVGGKAVDTDDDEAAESGESW